MPAASGATAGESVCAGRAAQHLRVSLRPARHGSRAVGPATCARARRRSGWAVPRRSNWSPSRHLFGRGRHRQEAVHSRASAGAEPARTQHGPGTDPVLLVQFDRPCARLPFWHIRCEHCVLLRAAAAAEGRRRGGRAGNGIGPRVLRARYAGEQDAPPRICSAARCEVKEAGSSAPSSRAAR